MKLLLYCIFEGSAGPIPEKVAGVDGLPMEILFAGGLGAAVSRVSRDDLKANVARALAYGEVIEIFYQNFTVIPMRYGSFLQDEDAVERFLVRNEEAFKRLLQRLNGCVEMGIRILLPDNLDASSYARKWCDLAVEPPGAPPGRAYLQSRRRSFKKREFQKMVIREAVENCKAALNGHFVDVKVEEEASIHSTNILQPQSAVQRNSSAVVHFLVRRDCLEAFYRSFEKLSTIDAPEMLLSGPWPPYNFATLSFSL